MDSFLFSLLSSTICVHRRRTLEELSSSLCSLFTLCSIQYLETCAVEKFDRVLDFFFQNSIVCRVLKFHPLSLSSLFSVIIFSFLLPRREREERERSRLLLSSYSLCIQSAVPQQRRERNRRRTSERTTTHITITRFIHTLSLLTFDLKEEEVHTKNDLSVSSGTQHHAKVMAAGSHSYLLLGGRACRCRCSEIATTWTRERRTRGTVRAP